MAGLQSVAAASLPALVDTIEIRTLFTPPVVLKVSDLVAPGPPSPTMKLLRPTLILRGAIGEQVIAPAGALAEDTWKVPVFLVCAAGVLGLAATLTTAYRIGRGRK